MDADLKNLWEKTLDIIKSELSEVSFNTWIKSCEPISISSDTIKISVPNSFTQDILDKRYKDLVVNSIKAVCSKQYNIEFIIKSDNYDKEDLKNEINFIDYLNNHYFNCYNICFIAVAVISAVCSVV